MSKMELVKLGLVHNNKFSPWIKTDLEIFSTKYNVQEIFVPSVGASIKLIKGIINCHILVFWFGSFNFLLPALIARLLGKKIIIIAGGYDTSRLPELGYGAFCENLISRFLRHFLFSLADKVIGVSQSNASEMRDHLILKDKPEWVYLGFKRNNQMQLRDFNDRENRIVMIANIDSALTFKLKGMDVFIEMARKMPDMNFIHMGKIDFALAIDLPRNLILKGMVANNSPEFYEILNSSKIIFQHSMLESFCAAVVDGALMGCMPIVSDRFSLPEVVGSQGMVVKYNDQVELEKQIRKACASYSDVQKTAEYFYDKFSYEKRRNQLLKVVASL